jgi:nascent polypeptide-associated complex subunit alpha
MIPGMNPRDMQKAMKRMGIQQVEIEAIEVIIRQADKDIVISNPNVSKVKMMGQETLQITGEISERAHETKPEINQDDVQTVMDQTGASEEAAKTAIEKHEGDLAAAIMELSE